MALVLRKSSQYGCQVSRKLKSEDEVLSAEPNCTIYVTESEKQQPKLKKRHLSLQQLQQPKQVTGQKGEQLARSFLTENSFSIVECNVRFKTREIDIIAFDTSGNEKELVFVEVKYRQSGKYGNPSLAVGKKKLRNLESAAQQYIQHSGWSGDYRFDIIAITGEKIEHFKNITWGM